MAEQDLTDDKFNSNDLGYFTNNNFLNHSVWAQYHWVKPTKWYNNIFLNFNAVYSQLFTPRMYQNANFNVNANSQLKNLWQVGGLFAYEPNSNNFYESRVPGRVFKNWGDWFVNGWVQTNSSKKYSVNAQVLYVERNLFNSKRYQYMLQQNYRFSKKFSVNYSFDTEPQNDNVGYASMSGNDIIFGRRDVSTVENILNLKYSFNDRMVFTTKIRHYWSKVNYKEFFTLAQDGTLQKNTTFNTDVNQDYNIFTVDAVYTWQFAPGSFINLVWKNNATTIDDVVKYDYFKSLNNTILSPQNNNFSIKIIYFIDYLDLKKKVIKRA